MSTTLCRIDCRSNLDRLIALRTSAVALCRSRASFSSRVSRATFVSSRAADELRGRTAFGAMRLLRAPVLRSVARLGFATCSGAPSHCRPSAQDKASWRDQTSTPGDGSSQCVGVTFALGLKKRSFSKTAQMCAAHEQVRRLGRYVRAGGHMYGSSAA